MYISKQVIAVSSDTANWTGKRAAVGEDINGALLTVHITDGGSTAEKFSLYRGTTEAGNLVMAAVFPSSSVSYRPRGRMTENSTAAPTRASTGTLRFPFYFANEKPTVIMSGTGKSFSLTLYVDGVAASTGQSAG